MNLFFMLSIMYIFVPKVFYLLLCSIMLLETRNRSTRLSNDSAASGFYWEEFNFEACEGQEEGRTFFGFITALCFAFGLPASVAILWEMFKTHRRGTPFTPNTFFILNLTTMDVVFLVFIPPGLLNHFIWRRWEFEACWNFVFALNTCGRPLLMACICLDCYLAVVHPITYHKRKRLTPRVVMAGIVWALTIACGIVYFFFYKLFFTMFSTVPLIITIIITGICDSFILYTLGCKSDPGRKNIHPQKQRAIQTVINSLVMVVLSYLPPIILLSIRPLFGSFNIFLCTVGIPLTITSTLGSAVMPILHLNTLGKFDRFKLGCCRNS